MTPKSVNLQPKLTRKQAEKKAIQFLRRADFDRDNNSSFNFEQDGSHEWLIKRLAQLLLRVAKEAQRG